MNTKDRIIQALESAKGTYISGETLADQCGVSRNAVWKAVSELRTEGYVIKSANNRGYMLEENSDILSAAGICAWLDGLPGSDEAGPVAPEQILVYDEIDSTNTEAGRMLLFHPNPMLHGTVIAAKSQTAGKGHGGSSFYSPGGGIYLSLILEPDRVKKKDRSLAKSAARTVQQALEQLFHIRTERKEDSSIYAGGEKICGILTEGISDLETGVFSSYIIGIGVRTDLLAAVSGEQPGKNRIAAELIRGMLGL